MPMSKLNALIDSFGWLAPFSVLGAFFGDVIRKDLLTPKQRVAAGAFSFMMGPLCGAAANREFGIGEFTSYVIAAIAPTVIYDLVGLFTAFIRFLRDDPRDVFEVIKGLIPWGRK